MAAEPEQYAGSEATATSVGRVHAFSERDVCIDDSRPSQHVPFSREGMYDFRPASNRSRARLADGSMKIGRGYEGRLRVHRCIELKQGEMR